MKTIVYRVQPVGAKLHARRSRTSSDEFVPGVFVFGSFGSIDAVEWVSSDRRRVELAKIACDEKDLYDPGDAQGFVLRKGRGKIIDRAVFRNLDHLNEWVEELQQRNWTW